MQGVEQALEHHPARQWDNPNALLKRQKRLQKLYADLVDRRAKLSKYTGHYWQGFLDIMDVLQHFNGLEETRPTDLGEMAAAIRGDNELWLALALTLGNSTTSTRPNSPPPALPW
jgi:superfamily II RNA helicase